MVKEHQIILAKAACVDMTVQLSVAITAQVQCTDAVCWQSVALVISQSLVITVAIATTTATAIGTDIISAKKSCFYPQP